MHGSLGCIHTKKKSIVLNFVPRFHSHLRDKLAAAISEVLPRCVQCPLKLSFVANSMLACCSFSVESFYLMLLSSPNYVSKWESLCSIVVQGYLRLIRLACLFGVAPQVHSFKHFYSCAGLHAVLFCAPSGLLKNRLEEGKEWTFVHGLAIPTPILCCEIAAGLPGRKQIAT